MVSKGVWPTQTCISSPKHSLPPCLSLISLSKINSQLFFSKIVSLSPSFIAGKSYKLAHSRSQIKVVAVFKDPLQAIRKKGGEINKYVKLLTMAEISRILCQIVNEANCAETKLRTSTTVLNINVILSLT